MALRIAASESFSARSRRVQFPELDGASHQTFSVGGDYSFLVDVFHRRGVREREVVMKEDGYACITTYRHPDMSVTPGPEARKCTRDHSLWPSLSNYSNSSRSISSDLNWKHPSVADDCLRPICAYQSSRTTVISSEPNHDDLYLRTNSFSGLEPLVCLLPTSE